MKAKYFKKIRNQVKWYKVSYRDSLFFSFSDEKEILAKSPENACVRYHKRTGCFVSDTSICFVNKYNPNNITQYSESLSRFKVCIGKKVMYFD